MKKRIFLFILVFTAIGQLLTANGLFADNFGELHHSARTAPVWAMRLPGWLMMPELSGSIQLVLPN